MRSPCEVTRCSNPLKATWVFLSFSLDDFYHIAFLKSPYFIIFLCSAANMQPHLLFCSPNAYYVLYWNSARSCCCQTQSASCDDVPWHPTFSTWKGRVDLMEKQDCQMELPIVQMWKWFEWFWLNYFFEPIKTILDVPLPLFMCYMQLPTGWNADQPRSPWHAHPTQICCARWLEQRSSKN